jgi:predicted dehydrogenase
VDLAGEYNWRTDPAKAGGGYFIDLASHGLDLLLYLLGDVVDVRGMSVNQQKLYPAEDAVAAVWQYESGCMGTGFWNFAAAERTDKLVIYGSKGRIEFSVFDEAAVQLFTSEQQLSLNIAHPENIQFYHIQAMVQDLLHGTGHPSTGATALKASWMMEQILK